MGLSKLALKVLGTCHFLLAHISMTSIVHSLRFACCVEAGETQGDAQNDGLLHAQVECTCACHIRTPTLWHNNGLTFGQCGVDESASNIAFLVAVLLNKAKEQFTYRCQTARLLQLPA